MIAGDAVHGSLVDQLAVVGSANAQSRHGLEKILAYIAYQSAVVEDPTVQSQAQSVVSGVETSVDNVPIDAGIAERPQFDAALARIAQIATVVEIAILAHIASVVVGAELRAVGGSASSVPELEIFIANTASAEVVVDFLAVRDGEGQT